MFPSISRSGLVLIRCMALNMDGACTNGRGEGEHIFSTLAHEFSSWLFDTVWVASEVMIQLGIVNAIISVFVTRAIDTADELRDRVKAARESEDDVTLQSLDKLLRALIHPHRKKQSNPK